MKKRMMIEAKLLESGLNRIRQTMSAADTGFITAFRNEYSFEENLERNKALIVDLRRYFDVTSVKGQYIEDYNTPDAKARGENVFFVSAATGNKHLKDYLFQFGKKYEQESVLFVPKGGEKGILIGTKEGSWPGLGQEHEFDNPVFGQSGEFFTAVHGRPFLFKNKVNEEFHRDGPKGFFGEWCRYLSTAKYEKKK
jgi:hypothetical protein